MAHHYLGNRMTANRALMDELGFALKHDGKEWLVIEDGADDRCATITEVVLWQALKVPGYLVTPIAPELDVTKILLNVVPGYDGEGLEIYAKSVDDVVALLTKQGERIEELESRVAAPAAPADLERMRHIANEWADMATSGHVWLRNIVAGISTPADALANSTLALQHCRAVNDAPKAAPVAPACSPTLTECPRCRNDIAKCDGVFAAPVAPAEPSGYQRGWADCMALWADHMKRMNAALAKSLPAGYANNAYHLYSNVREALDAAPVAPATAADKRVCHAPGDRCMGCDHYKGLAPTCKFAPAGDKPATSEPGAYAVWWGVGSMRVNSVHLERATAEQVASEIKSHTEIRPLSYTAPPDVQRDVDRYRWLRDVNNSGRFTLSMNRRALEGGGDELDSAIDAHIDAAMAAKVPT